MNHLERFGTFLSVIQHCFQKDGKKCVLISKPFQNAVSKNDTYISCFEGKFTHLNVGALNIDIYHHLSWHLIKPNFINIEIETLSYHVHSDQSGPHKDNCAVISCGHNRVLSAQILRQGQKQSNCLWVKKGQQNQIQMEPFKQCMVSIRVFITTNSCMFGSQINDPYICKLNGLYRWSLQYHACILAAKFILLGTRACSTVERCSLLSVATIRSLHRVKLSFRRFFFCHLNVPIVCSMCCMFCSLTAGAFIVIHPC